MRRGSRSHLKNVYYFSGVYSHIEELWYEVLDYIESNYDLDTIEHIYLCGDGAKWVREGTGIIPKTSFVLDRYHLAKRIVAALGKGNELWREIWKAIMNADLEKAKAVLKEAYRRAQTEGRGETVKRCRRYIIGNWDGIAIYKTSLDVSGCSAEGHVSHVLLARLSSRPMGWSRLGMDQMARIRVLKANGINIKEQYLKQRGKPTTVLKVCQTTLKRQRMMLERPPFEMLGNMPALKGPTSYLTKILRAIKSA